MEAGGKLKVAACTEQPGGEPLQGVGDTRLLVAAPELVDDAKQLGGGGISQEGGDRGLEDG